MATHSSDTIELDAAGLKALAHPLRMRLLAALRSDGPSTATALAERFGTNSGQTSYHLRVLADAGMVDEDAALGTARQRFWRARHHGTHIDPRSFRDDPVAQERLRWLQGSAAAFHDRLYDRWLDDADTYSLAWREAADASDWQLRLAPDELTALTEELAGVVRRHAARADERDSASTDGPTERVVVVLRAFPAREVDLS